MWFATLFAAAVLSSVSASGVLSIVAHPKSLTFKDSHHLKQSDLSNVYSTALGFSINPEVNNNDNHSPDEESAWRGMYIVDPFNLAEAIVNIHIEGVDKNALERNIEKIHSFPLSNNEHEQDTWDELITRVQQRYPYGNSVLARIELGNGIDAIKDIDSFKKIKSLQQQKVQYLDPTIPDDNKFLKDIAVLNALASNIADESQLKPDGKPDVFWIILKSLHSVHDLHGQNSSAAEEANNLLFSAIEKLSAAFYKAYNKNALVTLTTSDEEHTRRFVRAADEPSKDETKPGKEDEMKNLNLAKNYNADYPVIFNIILWFGVAMFFALLAIALVIGNMDPGRDSIIYRMTSNRMKKDN